MIYAVGDRVFFAVITPVLKLAAEILEASDKWPRDASRTHVEMRNFINELRSEAQHREAEERPAQQNADYAEAADRANEDLR